MFDVKDTPKQFIF